jgi:hypothetical protein
MAKAAYAQWPLPNSTFTKAKTTVDSIAIPKTDSLQKNWNGTQNRLNDKLDSLRSLGNLEKYKDSLTVIGWADSLKQKVQVTFANEQNAIQFKIDSLLVRNEPTLPLQRKIDSLQNKQQTLLNEVSAKQNQLQEKLNARYQKWGGSLDSLRLKALTFDKAIVGARSLPNVDANIPGMDKAGNQLNSLNSKLPATRNIKLPNASLPKSAIPNTPLPNPSLPNISVPNTSLPNTSLPNTSLPSLKSNDFANLNLSKDLNNVGGMLSVPGAGEMKQWNDQLKNVSQPMKEVTGKLDEAKDALRDPSKAAEGVINQIGEVNTMSKEIAQGNKLLKDNEAMKTAEAMKDPKKLKEEVAQKAIDHFAGKEQVLKQAMDQMAKIKRKVPSLAGLDKLPKNYWWPKNGLKGKPFRERVRYGLNFGVQGRKDSILVDLYPNASYYLTGRIELGGGMIYRLRESTKTWQFDQANPIWGFNMFGTFKTFKSVRFRLETDAASYPKYGSTDEPVERKWRWTCLIGFQTEFELGQHFKGNVQMLYNFEKSLTAGFPEQLVLRFGIQYKLLPKKPLTSNQKTLKTPSSF